VPEATVSDCNADWLRLNQKLVDVTELEQTDHERVGIVNGSLRIRFVVEKLAPIAPTRETPSGVSKTGTARRNSDLSASSLPHFDSAARNIVHASLRYNPSAKRTALGYP
jgi:hypothetical protein